MTEADNYVLVVYGKGMGRDTYWRADTPEAFAAASLYILTEREEEGWYPEPTDEDPEGYHTWHERMVDIVSLQDPSGHVHMGNFIPYAYDLLMERYYYEGEALRVDIMQTIEYEDDEQLIEPATPNHVDTCS